MTTAIQDAIKRIEEHSSRVVRGAKGQRKGRSGTDRYYTYTDEQGTEHALPSVTTVLQILAKPALIPWATKTTLQKVRQEIQTRTLGELGEDWIDDLIEAARKHPDEVRDQAADLGTRAHEYLAPYSLNGDVIGPPPADIKPIVEGYLAWKDSVDLVISLTEVAVANPLDSYAGTIDAIGYTLETKRLVVLDWKTGSGIYPEMALQAAAYAEAVSVIAFEPVDVWVIRFARDEPGFEAKQVETVLAGGAYEAFDAANRAWAAMQRKDNLWKEK